MSKLTHLPTARYTPQVLLHQALDELDEVESVVVLKIRKDGDTTVDWSNMKSGSLATAALLLNDLATRAIAGEFGYQKSEGEEGA